MSIAPLTAPPSKHMRPYQANQTLESNDFNTFFLRLIFYFQLIFFICFFICLHYFSLSPSFSISQSTINSELIQHEIETNSLVKHDFWKEKNICKRATLSDKNVHFFSSSIEHFVLKGAIFRCISQCLSWEMSNVHLSENGSARKKWFITNCSSFRMENRKHCMCFFQNIFFTPMFVIKEYSASIRFTRFLLRTQESWADRTILLQWREKKNKSCGILHHVYCLVIGNGLLLVLHISDDRTSFQAIPCA